MRSTVIKFSIWNVLLFLGTVVGGQQPSLVFRAAPANVFPDTIATVTVQIASQTAMQGRLIWSFQAAGAIVARGEQAVDFAAPGEMNTQIALAIPPARPDASIEADLRLDLIGPNAKASATAAKSFRILGHEPWLGRQKWLKSLNILLFDPEQTTAPLLEQANIPCTLIHNPDAIPDFKNGILLVAEKTDFRDYRALPEIMLNAAAHGVPVVCLAPAGGELDLSGAKAAKTKRPQAITFSDETIIQTLDKHLDQKNWGNDGQTIYSSFHLDGQNGQITAQIQPDQEGWPWIEMFFSNHSTRLICAGFAVMKKWDETPAARHLFLRILEHAIHTNFTQTGTSK